MSIKMIEITIEDHVTLAIKTDKHKAERINIKL